jgi:hypothetical protein
MFVLRLVDSQFAAFKTDTMQNLHDFAHVLDEEHGASQFDMSEITGSVDIRKPICWTNQSWLQHAHSGVEETAYHGTIVDIRFFLSNLDHRILANLFGGQHTKLNPNDS